LLHFSAVAALGLALSACGGGSSGTASTAQSSTPGTASSGTSSSSSSGSTSSSGSSSSSGTATGSSGSTSGTLPTAPASSVAINWTPPTENVDGTPLTNLAGYDIHYGTASGKYTQTISVSNAGIATYVVQDLTPGTYYFAIAAVNADGTESPLSSEVSATVN
jgi:Fibronectin type III domain